MVKNDKSITYPATSPSHSGYRSPSAEHPLPARRRQPRSCRRHDDPGRADGRMPPGRGPFSSSPPPRQMPLRRHPTPVLVPPTDAVEGVALSHPHSNRDMGG
jgi:hypothetical protein